MNLAILQDKLACKQIYVRKRLLVRPTMTVFLSQLVSGLKMIVAKLSSSREAVEVEVAGIGHQVGSGERLDD